MTKPAQAIDAIELRLDMSDDEVSVAAPCVKDDGDGADSDDGSEEEEEDEDMDDSDEDEGGSDIDEPGKSLARITKALKAVAPPGSFFTSGVRSIYPQPGIVVDGFGELPLPLIDVVAQALIQKCHLAPFGHGEKTIVDTQVRNTWELSSDQFRIQNPAWQAMIDEMVLACYIPMGIRSTMRVEAKLYKLLVYEAGGKFDRHQDSEKEEGMFGTLVVVLPCRFEGGQLIVHDPCTASRDVSATAATKTADDDAGGTAASQTSAFTWDAGTIDPLAIKHAAFYGDCPHEIKPVTQGYRLCLTYNLVCKDASPHSELGYLRTLPRYESLKSALCSYFRPESDQGNKKRQRTDEDGDFHAPLDLTDPTSHRQTKLVYVMDHKYTKSGLAFKYLKNKDALVAASLARFCEDSEGAFELFLAKLKYTFEWSGEEETSYNPKKAQPCERTDSKVELLDPWVSYPAGVMANVSQDARLLYAKEDAPCEMENEVVPCGYFNQGISYDGRTSQDYTGNEGASLEKWYNSAALVLVPLCESWSIRFYVRPNSIYDVWVPLVDAHPRIATFVASVFGQMAHEWSVVGDKAETVLEAIRQLGNIQVLQDILVGCEQMEIQPKLRDTVAGFSWDAVVSMAKTVSSRWKNRSNLYGALNTMRLVLSLLDGVDDVRQISSLLLALTPTAHATLVAAGSTILCDDATPPDEFARLLKLAGGVSEDLLRKLAKSDSSNALVMVVIPALRSVYDDGQSQAVVAAMQEARSQLEPSLPKIRALSSEDPYWQCPQTDFRSKCQTCPTIRNMLASAAGSATVVKTDYEDHVQRRRGNGSGLVCEPSPTDPSMVLISKAVECDLYEAAVKELAQLDDVLARGWVQGKTGQVVSIESQ